MVEDVKRDLINSLYQLTKDEKTFFISNPDLQPDLFYFLANNNDPVVLGTLLYKLFRSVLDSEEAKYFYDYYMAGFGGDVHISSSSFNNIVSEIEQYGVATSGLFSTVLNGNAVNGQRFRLNKPAKYRYVLGTFTYYTNPNNSPFGLYDLYDFNPNSGFDIFDTIIGKNPSRGIWGEWITRAQNVVDLLVTSPFSLYHPKPFKIYYP